MPRPLARTRVADEAIYHNRDFFDTPKEYFTLVLNEMERELGHPASILDIGCANGAFLHHARSRFSNAELTGVEPVRSLVDLAREYVGTSTIVHAELFDDLQVTATAVTMLGVMGIFFEPVDVVRRLLELTTSGGAAFIFSPFNEESIDVVLNYRRAPNGDWETGYNLFSMHTMEHICAELGAPSRWVSFSLSQTIPKTSDPMRSWTEPFRGNPHHIVYGSNMFSTMKLLVVRKP